MTILKQTKKGVVVAASSLFSCCTCFPILLFFSPLGYVESCHSCYLSADCTFLYFFPIFYFFPLLLPNMFNSKHLHHPPLPPCLSNTPPLCNFTRVRILPPRPWLFQPHPPSRPIVKVGLFPCVAPCAGSAHPRQHHPGQPRHPGHPADPRGGGPEPRGAGPDDMDGEVRRGAGQATRRSHTGGDQRHLQHEAVSALTAQWPVFKLN